ncbi:ArsR/SmtB family transcription factor [Brachybacterium muris]|uniref:ArsR family transcriptional regulator n=1 Tax=Brachybacterium muris UCD-AY4 TaxID=1249481 RepID=A0A022KXY4_9MICO|nr:ArsR family transcriptional regulator [Brachybacterium muris UCD-AY4]
MSTADRTSRPAPPPGEGEVDVAAAVGIFAMLADATRVRIVLALREGEMAVGEIAGAVGKPVPAVSQHLAKLRLSAMVESRQDGNRVYYRLINDHAARLVGDAMHQAEHAASPHPAHHATGGSAHRH